MNPFVEVFQTVAVLQFRKPSTKGLIHACLAVYGFMKMSSPPVVVPSFRYPDNQKTKNQ